MKEKPLKGYAIDFDGTLSRTKFNPINGIYEMGEPFPNIIEAVNKAHLTNEITIFTARPKKEHKLIRRWLIDHGVYFDKVSNKKKPAKAYVDDRGLDPDTFIVGQLGKPELLEPFETDYLGESD